MTVSGDSVPQSEWVNLADSLLVEGSTPSATESMILEQVGSTLLPVAGADAGASMLPVAPVVATLGTGAGVVSDEERLKYEEERARLYEQLDEKV